MTFSERTNWTLAPNPLAQKIKELRDKKTELLDLTVSNPTLCGFRYLNKKMLTAFSNPKNLIYDPDAHGLRKTREALCAYYRENKIALSPDQIFITASTSEAYSFVFRLIANAGDTILAPQPSYPLLDYLTALNDIEIMRYPLIEDTTWKIDTAALASTIEGNPRAILVVHPNNPTGNYVREDERLAINQFCKTKNAAIISDEVFYEFNIKPGPPPAKSFAQNHDVLTFTLGGISKLLGLPQMKLSWIVVTGPADLRTQAIERLEIIADTYLSANTPVQNALGPWLRIRKKIQKEILQRVRENNRVLAKKLSSLSAVKVLESAGGWNAVLKMPERMNDEEWALFFLEKDRLVVHPGYLFDFPAGAYLVLSLLVEPKLFKEGLGRFETRMRAPNITA